MKVKSDDLLKLIVGDGFTTNPVYVLWRNLIAQLLKFVDLPIFNRTKWALSKDFLESFFGGTNSEKKFSKLILIWVF